MTTNPEGTNTMNKPLVIYHGNCTDGFGAAYAAWCKLGDTAEYVPATYGTFTWPVVTGRDVYILDFSFPREEMEATFRDAARVVWLDHHKSAFEMWDAVAWMEQPNGLHQTLGSPAQHTIKLNNNKSGVMLSWEHFHPGVPVPKWVKWIDDRDRWVFAHEESRRFHAGLALLRPWTFTSWKAQFGDAQHALDAHHVEGQGGIVLQVYAQQIAAAVSQATKCHIIHPAGDHEHNPWEWSDGMRWLVPGLAVNGTDHQSEVGHELANASGTYGMVWRYDPTTRKANVSLRSNGDYDVSAIAKVFGGGGHKNAAGFTVDMPTLLEWIA